MPRLKRFISAASALLFIALALPSCAQVAPWERGNLARRDMAITPDPALTRLRDHIANSKEASQGGHQGVSGGCGCN